MYSVASLLLDFFIVCCIINKQDCRIVETLKKDTSLNEIARKKTMG